MKVFKFLSINTNMRFERGLENFKKIGYDYYEPNKNFSCPYKQVISAYTDNFTLFLELNKYLRGAKDANCCADEKIMEKFKSLLSYALSKLPKYKGTVYRYQRSNILEPANIKIEKGFLSTSKELVWEEGSPCIIAGVDTFSSNLSLYKCSGKNLQVYKVKTGRDVSSISSQKQEKEVLLLPGTKFKKIKEVSIDEVIN